MFSVRCRVEGIGLSAEGRVQGLGFLGLRRTKNHNFWALIVRYGSLATF